MRRIGVLFVMMFLAATAVLFAETPVSGKKEEAPAAPTEAKASLATDARAGRLAPATGKTIFDYKDELKLTDDQVNKLKAAVFDRDNNVRTLSEKIRQSRLELIKLINQKSELNLIKWKLEEISKVQAQMRYDDIATGRKVEEALSPEQMTKWKSIQKEAVASAQPVKKA